MIVGTGDIASVLNDRLGAIFFASGVSNSACENYAEFKRERDLLLAQDTSLCLFYFSSINVPLATTAYLRHKMKMELLIRSNFNNFNILRLGNIVWGSNPNTFLNYIRNRKASNESFEIRDEWKYMLEQETLLLLTDNLPLTGQNTLNIFSYKRKVADLI